MNGADSLRKFFSYLFLGFALSAIKINLAGLQLFDIVKNVTITFMYNFIVGIPTGLALMFGTDLYVYIKKNTRNEQYWF